MWLHLKRIHAPEHTSIAADRIKLPEYNIDKTPYLQESEKKRLAWIDEFELEYQCGICDRDPYASKNQLCPKCGRPGLPTGYMYWRKGDYRQRIKDHGFLGSPKKVEEAKKAAITAVAAYERDGNIGLVPWWCYYVFQALHKAKLNTSGKRRERILQIIDKVEKERIANRPIKRRMTGL